MASGRGLGRCAAILTLGGGLLSHALDEEGHLPGVREAAAVREYGERGLARPLLLLGCVAVAALVGRAVAKRPTPRRMLAYVVAGQAAMFASFEVVSRIAAGLDVAEVFVEPGFVAGVAVQVLIAAAFVTALLLTGRRVLANLTLPGIPWSPGRPAIIVSRASRAGTRHPERPVRGRAPPSRTVPVPTRGKDHPCACAGS
jgi:hypothetical protein